MSIESAFRTLSLRPNSLCRQCHRTFASVGPSRQEKSATAGFGDLLESSSQQSAAQRSRPDYPVAPRPADPSSTAVPPSPNSPAERASQGGTFDLARQMVTGAHSLVDQKKEAQRLADMQRTYSRQDLERQMIRRWKSGDVYAPHDLTGIEMAKWQKTRRKERQSFDVLHQLGIKPIEQYKNFSIMSEYVTEMGRIRHRNQTGLSGPQHRRMARAIRRSQGAKGFLMPSVHRHPEILIKQMAKRRSNKY